MTKQFFRFALLLLAVSLTFSACQPDSGLSDKNLIAVPVDTDPRGDLIRVEKLFSYSKAETRAYLESYDPNIVILFPVSNGVDVYKLVYKTIDPFGNETKASGALVVPSGIEYAMPIASYQHGTAMERSGVPSAESNELLIGIGMAADGYVVSMPDYLGLGESPGPHPYIHAKSEATAGVDMLRASKTYVETLGLSLDGKLFLFGYSQGGHATMALHREIQFYHSNEFTVTASAPMSGPYDVSGVQKELILSDESYADPSYLPYILHAYNYVYSIMPFADAMVAPYNEQIPPLMDGYHSGGQVNAVMPDVPNEILQPDLLHEFATDPEHPFRLALKDNDVIDWRPDAPVRLLYCSGDQHVSSLNSLAAYYSLRSLGADVEHFDLGAGNGHNECVLPCLLQAKAWFDSFLEE